MELDYTTPNRVTEERELIRAAFLVRYNVSVL